jgi:hypothetical protein
LPTLTPTETASETPTDTPTETPTSEPTATDTPSLECVCDCNEDGIVTIDELVRCVERGLELIQPGDCPRADPNRNGKVEAHELVRGVDHFLNSCP